jgi:DNA polymerase epsilon subunit 1
VQLAQSKAEDELEATLGFPLFASGEDKLGWLMNMQSVRACQSDAQGWKQAKQDLSVAH